MPFLYLPDAVSLILLVVVLSLLRQTAGDHCRQELHRLRLGALLFWSDEGLPLSHRAYVDLARQIRAASELTDRVSPARLFFISHRCGKLPPQACLQRLPDWCGNLGSAIEELDDRKAREKARRIQLEFEISFGMFYLLGSLSGWMVAAVLSFRVIRRMMLRKPDSRTDWAFDLIEKVFSRLGRRSLRLALQGNV
jgi:hypothetical protein